MLAQMLQVETKLTRLRTSLVSSKPIKSERMTFDLQADIKTVSRDGPRLKIRYSIGIETFPVVYRAEMQGTAVVNAELMAKDESLEDLGEAVISDLALTIYKRNYESLYLALSSLGLEAPSPWLVKEPHLIK